MVREDDGPTTPLGDRQPDLMGRGQRSSRSRRRGLTAVVVGGTAALVVAAAVVAPRLLGDDDPAPVPVADTAISAPDSVHVTCTDQGPQVDTATVAARSDGVVLVVDSTLPKGSYLTYAAAHDGPAGGDLARGTTTYAFPPGEVRLDCATPPGMDPIGATTLTVVDPHGYWSEATLADHGCRAAAGQPSWAGGLTGTGPTAQEAVDGLLANLGAGYTAEPAPTGYTGADTQTWVASRDGTAELGLAVTRGRDGTFSADPDVLCG